MDNQTLIEGIARHERTAISHLMQKMRPIIVKLLIKKSAGEAQAEDIVMDAMEALYREISGKGPAALIEKLQHPRPAELQTYVSRIALNLYFKSLRRNKVQTGVTSAQEMGYKEEETVSTYIHQVEQRRLFDAKMNQLDESCRQVLNLFFKKISMLEIAEKLGTTEQYAKKKKFKCKSKLIELIRKDALYNELKI